MSLLSTHKLKKIFNGVSAVNGVSLSFEPGKITSVIGPNGCGKTTMINLITGMMPFDDGNITIGEHTKIDNMPAYDVATYGITRTFQQPRLFEQMTVLDNILVVLTERNVFKSLFERHDKYHIDIAEKILRRVDIFEKKDNLAVNLSYGQRKLLEIARVIAMGERTDGESHILFFDEPFAGLFPEMVKLVSSILKELRDEGKAVVLVEHNMDLIRELSDHVYVLDAGEHLAEGTAKDVFSNRGVIEAYLGD
ncbi:hypothetical protein A2997_01585 [Candidatus Nomurabacteria bacterium RIFCSPLOWO2_01_FULL_36_10b]|uniref:ABC transporter domain-containing protein n=1 Tax=Candidatus Nomurabacteria bacterium RIFCSPLOWO2_01_FULL_36_10b TaxID=1801766 RepID=A0A1F6WNF0_9BACT|nr:MAG: hypothetical protein A2997_01585 [Candidatus Nomurabacteria bacterium RIFCSPLOWO2_01_FULL_36_10b]